MDAVLSAEVMHTLARDEPQRVVRRGRRRLQSPDEAGMGLAAARTPRARPKRACRAARPRRSESWESGSRARGRPRAARRADGRNEVAGWPRFSAGLGAAIQRTPTGLRGRASASLRACGLVADHHTLCLVGGLTHPVTELAVQPS